MIKSITLKNFKSIKDQKFEFSNFDLLVGRNNSGKSTVLQALAIWQFCINEFERTLRETKKSGSDGIQIILPNFTALPVPEFNLLWTNRTDRQWNGSKTGQKKQEYIFIKINVEWIINTEEGKQKAKNLEIELHYHSSQTIYAKPTITWKEFTELKEKVRFPKIVYVPPFSGLEPTEKWLADPNLQEHVGKAQPGSVLRNLLYRVIDKQDENQRRIHTKDNKDWLEIQQVVKDWFSIDLQAIQSDKNVDTRIICEYKKDGVAKKFDIISGGSGFHQTLTLLAFFYGYEGINTLLFDEPDAHLHVNLQKEVLTYFKQKAVEKGVQFIVATHAEEFIKGVSPDSIISILDGTPRRIPSSSEIITALADIGNIEATSAMQSPYILYVEGEDDERIIRAWANILGKDDVLRKFFISTMGGGSKEAMKNIYDSHYRGLKHLAPNLKRLMLFDYDADSSYHPSPDDTAIYEWRRKNIDNYLLVSDTWKRAIIQKMGLKEGTLFTAPLTRLVDDFFVAQNLTLPPKQNWQNVSANIFGVVDGKGLLFSNKDSLFHLLCEQNEELKISKDILASAMAPNEIHSDIIEFFDRLEHI